ncbi:MAG: nucleoside deaminase [Ilumatobacteraceae bacterium]|nr:nucleoside deaminase [Ilumatobacteraceae bacterium]
MSAHDISTAEVIDLGGAHDEIGMEAALDIARAGLTRGELPIGAVVVADGRIVGRAHTEEVTQRRLLVHAELLALEEADRADGWDRRRATLYTTLEPCLMCLGAAATAMVGRIVWALKSDSDGAGRLATEWSDGRSADLPHPHLPAVTGPVAEDAARDLFRAYVDARGDSCDPFVRWAATIIGEPPEPMSTPPDPASDPTPSR